MLHGIVNGTSGVFLLSSGVQGIASFLNGDICALSSDGYHYADSLFSDHVGEGKDGAKYAEAICKFCGEHFLCYATDLPPAYDDYVETLPAPSYTSDGSILWSPKLNSMVLAWSASPWRYYYCPHGEPNSENSLTKSCVASFDCENMSVSARPSVGNDSFSFDCFELRFKDIYPIDGYYLKVASLAFKESSISYVSKPIAYEYPFGAETSASLHYAGASYSYGTGFFRVGGSGYKYFSAQCYAPVYKVTPFNPSGASDTYNINTRPTSITGGNYGIVGDNGQLTKVEDNRTIINETNNTFYNPATGQTVPIVNWSYDYSDRSYKVTLESGDTATITYGDENITIQETTITEGDTITNNYTIYYLIDGSGSVTPPCEHDWQEASGTDPTCTLPGKVTLSCAKCQQTKTETLPALGHDWQVKQTVTTQYDDTGQLIQEGYTIFECSRCKEQYKSPDGSIPPGGGSGTDPGGEEEGGGFLSWLFGKLGELLGTIGDGILNLLQTALEKIFGGLIDLVNSLFENLAKLLDLFGSVGEAFQVLWTWLPPEVTVILVAGVSIFVFVALLKFFMK